MTAIVDIKHATISLASGLRNADISFDTMTASALVVVSDLKRNGRPLVGVSFDSIGRYAHGSLLEERFIPRILNASPDDYISHSGPGICPHRLWDIAMQNEKAGGHGERAGAVGLLDAAFWDLQAKIEDKPLWGLLNEKQPGAQTPSRVAVYASGGHYSAGDHIKAIRNEIEAYQRQGYRRFKIKAGGTDLDTDLKRIDAAFALLGFQESELAIDLNCGLTAGDALDWLKHVEQLPLAWVEEPVDPLDYQLLSMICQNYAGSVCTGENIFSLADVRNLMRYGGLRANVDFLNFDISLSYGLVEYFKILDLLKMLGWKIQACKPHAGHLLSAHAAAGLGLGGHETAPSHPIYGDYPSGWKIADGYLELDSRPGIGLEETASLKDVFASMLP